MERRNFIRKTAIGSACAMAGLTMSEHVKANLKLSHACKITVLKKELNQEWNEQFRGRTGEKCPLFEEGQEFVVDSPWEAPEGFCHWAWADIRTFIHLVREGKYDTFVSCCTDGFRPVYFRIDTLK